jgi:hypothetical protein
MIKTYYLYESHLDGVYYREEFFYPKRCEVCGDGDSFIGEFTLPKQLRRLMERNGFSEDYINEVVNEFEALWRVENEIDRRTK